MKLCVWTVWSLVSWRWDTVKDLEVQIDSFLISYSCGFVQPETRKFDFYLSLHLFCICNLFFLWIWCHLSIHISDYLYNFFFCWWNHKCSRISYRVWTSQKTSNDQPTARSVDAQLYPDLSTVVLLRNCFLSPFHHRSLFFSEGVNGDGMVVCLFTLCNLDKWFENLFFAYFYVQVPLLYIVDFKVESV